LCHVTVKVHREKRERQEYEEFRKENPLIKEMFSDLKRGLANVSEDEWRGIPEIGDYTIKRRKRFENFTANSDSMLAGALATATGALPSCCAPAFGAMNDVCWV
jgi:pre-mRNA-processing factor 6